MVKKNKAAVYTTRRIMQRDGATGDAGRAVGGKAKSTEAYTNTRSPSNLSEKNSNFCGLGYSRKGVARHQSPVTTTESHDFMFNPAAVSAGFPL